MVLLPVGFTVPPWPYLIVLVIAVFGIGYGIVRCRPAVTARHVLGLAPWIVVGSALHVLYVVESLPAVIAPLAGTGAVYLTVTTITGGVWLLADVVRPRTVPALLAASGLAVSVPLVGATLLIGVTRNTFTPVWPAAGVGIAVFLTTISWVTLRRQRPMAATATGWVGLLAMFGHTLDAVSTAVGVDVLGYGERTPLSRVILDAAAALPTADTIGTGWLFVLVKVGVVSVVIILFADYVDDEPSEGYPLLGVIAAVGLGPGMYNLLLFTIGS